MHDNINQILSTTKLYLDLAHTTSEGVTSEMIGVSSRNIMEAINEIRKLSRALVPPTLGDLGLIESIKDLCENFVNTNAFTVDFQHKNIKENQIADNQKLMLFRIIQEQTNNIIKHAKARHVKIHLRVLKGNVTLKITDDGEGFNLAKTKKGVGLTNIINRAELFNGHVEIVTAPKKGCSLKSKFPSSIKTLTMEAISILIADDHKLIRDTWSFILNTDTRFRVVAECSNGAEAVERQRPSDPR